MNDYIYELTCGQCKSKSADKCSTCKNGKPKSPKRVNIEQIESGGEDVCKNIMD
jgi:hypothetical protein